MKLCASKVSNGYDILILDEDITTSMLTTYRIIDMIY